MMGKQKDESVHHMMLRILAHWSGQANVLTIPRSLVQLTGSLEAALFLSQCLYWTGKSRAYADGWFFKSYREWQNEICLSKYHVQQAAASLESRGWLETDVSYAAGHPTRHYRVILEKLLDDIQILFDVPEEPEPEPPAAGLSDFGRVLVDVGVQSVSIGENLPMEPNRPVDNLQNGVPIGENSPMDRQKFANGGQKFANGGQKFANVTETTTETTAKISAEITVSADGAPAPESNPVLILESEPEPEREPALVMFEQAAGRKATPSEQYRISIAKICDEHKLGRWQRVLSGYTSLETEDDTWKALGQVKLAIYQMERR